MERITEHRMEIPPAMGGATAINFEPTGAGNAAITGDFVMKANEVNEAIRVLRANGIAITALHSHMLEEELRPEFIEIEGRAFRERCPICASVRVFRKLE